MVNQFALRESAIIASVKLEDLQATAAVRGILTDALVTVLSVRWFGSARTARRSTSCARSP